ncbi:MAG TPA: LysE family transporter [Armatimonadota bacterium]|nr:LysE family transporter [Armatimonadota bacterium]
MAVGSVFILSFITALSGALMPGPLLTVTIAQTARRGMRASVLLVAGHSLLELVLVVGLWFGLGHFLRIRPVIGTITVLGGLMLLWMGWGMIRDARRGALDIRTTANDGGEGVLRNPILTGMAVSISNPYWVIWWATIGLTFFAALSQNAVSTICAFYFGHIMGDILWYLAIGIAVATGRRLINPTVYRVIVQICGIFLIFLGGSFLYLIATGKLWAIKMSIHLLGK